MTADRHWERFDESSYDNANQMRECAQDAIEELLRRDRELTKIPDHTRREFVNELTETCRTYGQTQQLRARISRLVSKYLENTYVVK